MPTVTVGMVKTAPLEPLKGDTGLPKIQTALTHGHSLTGDMDQLTSTPLKDKLGKHALKKEVLSPCIPKPLGVLQNASKTQALLTSAVRLERGMRGRQWMCRDPL